MNAPVIIFLGVLILLFIVAHKMDRDDERKRRRKESLYRESLYIDRLSNGEGKKI